MDLDRLHDAIRPATRQQFATALVCMETSHNRAGGAVLSLDHMRAVHTLARARGVPVHTDGARVFNAAAALGVEPSSIGQHTDSICFCISKGLSAPIGSLLCGADDYIERARAFRRMVGGNMRQAGPLAAAGMLALETMVDRLEQDHVSAKRLAAKLHRLDASLVEPADVETNIVRVTLPQNGRTAAECSAALRERGVLVSPGERYALRFVTHRHVGEAEIDVAATAFEDVWSKWIATR
jgi:threonine aldolase